METQESNDKNSGGHFSELLKVEAKLAFRSPLGIGLGIGLPIILLVVFGLIGNLTGGTVGNTGLSIIDLWVPTIIVIGFIGIALNALPTTLTRYREIGWLRRVSTTPVSPSRILVAQMTIYSIIALATVLIVIFGSELIFHAPFTVGIPYFVLSIILSVATIFSLGLVVAAVAPSQAASSGLGGGLFFLMLFFAGLWVQPAQVGGLLATIMYYSPSGAAARALLYSVFNQAPPYTTFVTLIVYTIIFSFVAIRYFRWE